MARASILLMVAVLISACATRPSSPVRGPQGVPAPPVSDEQRVWLAAAEHVLADELQGRTPTSRMQVFHVTGFPAFRPAMERLKQAARDGYCGESARDSKYILSRLEGGRARPRLVGEVFEHRAQFEVTDHRPADGDYLRFSEVIFNRERTKAFLNVDISGLSGAIVRLTRTDGAWGGLTACVDWVSWP
jgi:hypothetical protein